MQFDLTFKNSEKYIKFLTENSSDINSIYFGLGSILGIDARAEKVTPALEETVSYLKRVPRNIKRYLTLNGRHTSADKYSDKKLRQVASLLMMMAKDDVFDGIIFADGYYIRAIYAVEPDLANYIDLVPSVNCFISSIQEVNRYIIMMQKIANKDILPSKIILDRSINRDIAKLKEVSVYIRENYPSMKIEVLANEGCILECPFKISHDIELSGNINNSKEHGLYKNSILSNYPDIRYDLCNPPCLSIYQNDPSEIVKSPFIRPQDVDYYGSYVDIIKISGKMFSDTEIMSMFKEYKQGFTNRNFVTILDAPRELHEQVILHTGEFPKDFLDKVGYCDKNCTKCSYCNSIFEKAGLIIQGD